MRLDRRIKLEKPQEGEDSYGQPLIGFDTYRECFAKIGEGTGNETHKNDQIEHAGQMKVSIRHPKQGRFPSVEDRIRWLDSGTERIAHIKHVQRLNGDRRHVVLYCVEVG